MLIMDSPGQLVGYIHCRTCYRCVHVDPEKFPPAPVSESYRARLRCTKCGGRGADLRIGWSCPSATPLEAFPKRVGGQVVYLSERGRNRAGDCGVGGRLAGYLAIQLAGFGRSATGSVPT